MTLGGIGPFLTACNGDARNLASFVNGLDLWPRARSQSPDRILGLGDGRIVHQMIVPSIACITRLEYNRY